MMRPAAPPVTGMTALPTIFSFRPAVSTPGMRDDEEALVDRSRPIRPGDLIAVEDDGGLAVMTVLDDEYGGRVLARNGDGCRRLLPRERVVGVVYARLWRRNRAAA